MQTCNFECACANSGSNIIQKYIFLCMYAQMCCWEPNDKGNRRKMPSCPMHCIHAVEEERGLHSMYIHRNTQQAAGCLHLTCERRGTEKSSVWEEYLSGTIPKEILYEKRKKKRKRKCTGYLVHWLRLKWSPKSGSYWLYCILFYDATHICRYGCSIPNRTTVSFVDKCRAILYVWNNKEKKEK